MAAPANPSFENGVGGIPDDWTVETFYAGYSIANFAEPASSDGKSVEDFDSASWGTDPYEYTVDTGSAAQFDAADAAQPSGVETFLRWSQNNLYAHTVDTGIAATFGSGDVEDFKAASWGTDPYATSVVAGSTFVELFDDVSWNGGDAYDTDVSGTDATFTGGTWGYEGFSPVAADLLFVPDPATNTCTTPTPHGRSNGFKVTITSTGRLAAGFVTNQVYYFVNVASSSFQLATTLGGTPIDITDVGSGSQYAHADESAYWTLTE